MSPRLTHGDPSGTPGCSCAGEAIRLRTHCKCAARLSLACRRSLSSLHTIAAPGSSGSPTRALASPLDTGRYEGKDRGKKERAAGGNAGGRFDGGPVAGEACVEGWVTRRRGVQCSGARHSAGADSTRRPLLISIIPLAPASICLTVDTVMSCLRSILRRWSWTTAQRFMRERSAMLWLCNRIFVLIPSFTTAFFSFL